MTGRVDKVSIVIPAFNEGENLVDTIQFIRENTAHPEFEVLVVDDGSTDGTGDRLSRVFDHDERVGMVRTEGLGAGQARSFGAMHASGEILVFLDAHCYVPPHWIDGLIQALADARIGMVGPAIATISRGRDARGLGMTLLDARLDVDWLGQYKNAPYPVPLLSGACQVVRKAELEQLGYYDKGMTRYGHEDLELCLRYWLMGYEVLVQPQSVVYHLFRDCRPYEIKAQEVIYNRLRMATLHLSNERVDRVVSCYSNAPGFDEIMAWLEQSDAMSRRSQLADLRSRDDDWFCTRFGCPI